MARALLFAIRAYQRISRLFNINTCRFHPSCSHYAIEAIVKYGALKGSALSVWRVLRCSPLSKGGFDPVKESSRLKK